jgi:RNA polymerase sigma-70 factor (ECF subfamily)
MTEQADADALLVDRAKRGEVSAFEMLVVKYQRRIERLISRMVRDADLVQDIAQETFIRAYRALPQFRGESAFYTWLYRIAVNTAKKALVERKRDPLINESALVSLSEDLRQAIVLREIEGLSYEEIADVMNCPIGTVRSRIFRAREAIATRLRPLLGTREGERW